MVQLCVNLQVVAFAYNGQVDVLISKLRWERGASSTFTVYHGRDAAINLRIVIYRGLTDAALAALPRWPTGVVVNGTPIATRDEMNATLAVFRSRVDALTMTYYDILDMYSMLTDALMIWLQVNIIVLDYYRRCDDSTSSCVDVCRVGSCLLLSLYRGQ